jgi:hypothetical protein
MCNWNTYTYDCGCLEVRLRDRCQAKLADDDMDPCLRMQRVRQEWRYHQGTLCDECQRRKAGGEEKGPRGSGGAVLDWAEVASRAHAEAVRLAESRSPEV